MQNAQSNLGLIRNRSRSRSQVARSAPESPCAAAMKESQVKSEITRSRHSVDPDLNFECRGCGTLNQVASTSIVNGRHEPQLITRSQSGAHGKLVRVTAAPTPTTSPTSARSSSRRDSVSSSRHESIASSPRPSTIPSPRSSTSSSPCTTAPSSPYSSATSSPRSSPFPRKFDGDQTPKLLVVGVTGVGKSTFISLLSQSSHTNPTSAPQVGHSLKSCTSTITPYPCISPTGQKYALVDTPGFDDSGLSDADVLTRLAHFFSTAPPIHGVIFLHRITDVRLSGSAIKTAEIIKRVCGEHFYPRFALVTSMWDLAKDREAAYRREVEMSGHPAFWGDLSRRRAQKFKFTRSRESASKVVEWFLTRRHALIAGADARPLLVVKQMRSGMLLSETDAGGFVMGELSKQRQKHVQAVQQLKTEICEAKRKKDEELVEMFVEEHQREMEGVQKNEIALRRLSLPVARRVGVKAQGLGEMRTSQGDHYDSKAYVRV